MLFMTCPIPLFIWTYYSCLLPWSCWTRKYPAFENSIDSDQLANWSESAQFVIKYVNIYKQPGSSNLIDWKLEVGEAS